LPGRLLAPNKVRKVGTSSRERARVKYPVQLTAIPEDQVPGVFDLVDRVGVAEPAAFLLVQVQAEAQARRIDPPVADLAQAPYSRVLRQGVCDPGQALRIRDTSKTVPLLDKPDPLALRSDRDILVPAMTISSLRTVCRAAGYAA